VLEWVETFELVDEAERVVRRPVVRSHPVVERVPMVDQDGSAILDETGAPIWIERPKTVQREEREIVHARRAILDETGAPRMRLGLRYDQLTLLLVASTAAP
jgi:hypothetical protein